MKTHTRPSVRWSVLLAPILVAALVGAPAEAGASTESASTAGTYTNPLVPVIPGGGVVESCPDPKVFRSQPSDDTTWYLYCTSNPLNATREGGHLVVHFIPMMQSTDLVNWTYVGDAIVDPPSFAEPTARFWGPEVVYSSTFDQYYLFYTVTDVTDEQSGVPGCDRDPAIAVAIGPTPVGPWTSSDTPVMAPEQYAEGCEFMSTIGADILDNDMADQGLMYYGGFRGGISVTPVTLTADGASVPDRGTQLAISWRYEGPHVVQRRGYYYLLASAANCCNGPLSGYTVFVGRSSDPMGPFVDRAGNSLMAGRVGGDVALAMNGNRWVGTGRNVLFRDYDGQWWTIYHAIDRTDPYFEGSVGFTKRPPMMDPIDWIHGWPTVRGGKWASDESMPAPAAQPGTTSDYVRDRVDPLVRGAKIAAASDEFDGPALDSKWSWVREPAATEYALEDGTFRFNTQRADLIDRNTASILTEAAPDTDFMVTARVRLNVPSEGCCQNYVQAGLVLYEDDDNYLKLVQGSNNETRPTTFAKELSPVPEEFPRYGASVVGPPSDWTLLRIVRKRVVPDPPEGPTEEYTALTSQDGSRWIRGGTWTHQLGPAPKIGLISMGGSGFVANFDYVRVHELGQ